MVGACGTSWTLIFENTKYSGQVYDWGLQQNTYVGFDLQTYWDGAGCGDFKYREFTWVADGSTASFDQRVQGATCNFYVCTGYDPTKCQLVTYYNGCWESGNHNVCGGTTCASWGDDGNGVDPNTSVTTSVWSYNFSPHQPSVYEASSCTGQWPGPPPYVPACHSL
jgi:hypothetical protein